ncbi:MAG: SH3 domain-containing protein [Caulobacteraceae bacterium]|nr:SH3 domain-containing protein [Caulobacteraceae bacterium]
MPKMTVPKLASAAAAAAMVGALTLGAAVPAQAQNFGGVLGCNAPGGKQEGGALLGAIVGAAAGSNLAKKDRTTGTALGAVVGAAAGSAIGCKLQHDDQDRRHAQGYGYGYQQPATYTHGRYRLDRNISPASFYGGGEAMIARTTVNLRAAPTTRSARVGQLRAGQRFETLARVEGTEWVLVGQNGVGVGYVHGAYVTPERYRYAGYGY